MSQDFWATILKMLTLLTVACSILGFWQRFIEGKPSLAWSMFLGLGLSGGVAFVAIFASIGLVPISMVTWIFALGIPFGIVHHKLVTDSTERSNAGTAASGTAPSPQPAETRPAENPAARIAETHPAVPNAAMKEAGSSMVERSWRLILLMVVITAVVEIVLPPRSETFLTTSFAGSTHPCTLHSRGHVQEPFRRTEIDMRILMTECGLVGGAFAVASLALRKRHTQAPAVTASRISSNAAIVLHGAAWLLPLAQAGMDTISFVDFPFVAILLVPNVFATIAAVRISTEDPTRENFPQSTLRRRIVLDRMFAVIWALVVFVSMMGLDFKGPMGGTVLVALAFWLGARAGRFMQLHFAGD